MRSLVNRHEYLLSDRAHRLLACGLCRQVAPFVGRPELLSVLETSEEFVDGRVSAAELGRARQFAVHVARSYAEMPEQEKFAVSVVLAATVTVPSSRNLYKTVESNTAGLIDRFLHEAIEVLAVHAGGAVAVAGFAAVFDDVSPHRTDFSHLWRTDTAVTLARTMYESRDFSAMPILADALQDAGCDSEEILNHCRSAELHVRGCWVCDLVLGKE